MIDVLGLVGNSNRPPRKIGAAGAFSRLGVELRALRPVRSGRQENRDMLSNTGPQYLVVHHFRIFPESERKIL